VKLNPYKEAISEPPNMLTLAGLAALSLGTLNPIPFLAGLVAETAYLLIVPDSNWYKKRLSAKEEEAYRREVFEKREALKKEVLPILEPTMVRRYGKLEKTRNQLADDVSLQNEWFYKDVVAKLDNLLTTFLNFSAKDIQFRKYVGSLLESVAPAVQGPPPKVRPVPRRVQGEPEPAEEETPNTQIKGDSYDVWIQESVKKITDSYEAEQKQILDLIAKDNPDDRTSAVVQKRLEVIQRRTDYIGRIGKILINLNHQMQLLEDTFGLINDEIRARAPHEVLTDIDDVVMQTNLMSEALDEVASLDVQVNT